MLTPLDYPFAEQLPAPCSYSGAFYLLPRTTVPEALMLGGQGWSPDYKPGVLHRHPRLGRQRQHQHAVVPR